MWVELGLHTHQLTFGLVDQLQAEVLVDLGFRFRLRGGEDSPDRAQRFDHGVDLLLGHRALPGTLGTLSNCLCTPGLHFVGPSRDEFRVGAGFQRLPVAGQLGVALGDHPLGLFCRRGGRQLFLSGVHLLDSRLQMPGVEGSGEPSVERDEHGSFAEVDVRRVLDGVGQGVFAGEAAAVVEPLAALLALHPALTDAAVQQSAQNVAVPGGSPFPVVAGRSFASEHLLDCLEGVHVDQGLMFDVVRPHPVVLGVPAQFGLVAEGDVIDVDEGFVLALLVPDFVAGVAGVGQDGAHRALGPGNSGSVAVAGPVMC
ncbi:hypothetical protein ABGB09_35005 [Streptomyces sp. B8F3]|uniref:hypothetical protein n=1 Tax=Streptomyces sp. B8F3 TaxID=3153573 RepID=UPI00325CADA0